MSTRVLGSACVSRYERFASSCEKSESARGDVYESESGVSCESCEAIAYARSGASALDVAQRRG